MMPKLILVEFGTTMLGSPNLLFTARAVLNDANMALGWWDKPDGSGMGNEWLVENSPAERTYHKTYPHREIESALESLVGNPLDLAIVAHDVRARWAWVEAWLEGEIAYAKLMGDDYRCRRASRDELRTLNAALNHGEDEAPKTVPELLSRWR